MVRPVSGDHKIDLRSLLTTGTSIERSSTVEVAPIPSEGVSLTTDGRQGRASRPTGLTPTEIDERSTNINILVVYTGTPKCPHFKPKSEILCNNNIDRRNQPVWIFWPKLIVLQRSRRKRHEPGVNRKKWSLPLEMLSTRSE